MLVAVRTLELRLCTIRWCTTCFRLSSSNTVAHSTATKETKTKKVSEGASVKTKKKASKSPPSKYQHTIFLPKTEFPFRVKNVLQHELSLQKESSWLSVYHTQRSQEHRSREFVLHDGPPYANGDPHIGHALNKIMKDITGRQKMLEGYKLHYVPGWDCHGLPIELKALQQQQTVTAGSGTSGVPPPEVESPWQPTSPLEIRQLARQFAERCVGRQEAVFKRWGVLGDWASPYLTHHPRYVAQELRIFSKLQQQGLIFQAHMPVNYSPSSRTTLAEAELQYRDDHVSQTVLLAMRASRLSTALKVELSRYGLNDDELLVPVYTTTPWTLPFNRAVCYNPSVQYCLVKATKDGPTRAMLWAQQLLPTLDTVPGLKWTLCGPIDAPSLEGVQYHHPLTGAPLPLLAADHVTADLGTGLVHTAPAHGPDDYTVGARHGLPLDSAVDDDGCYEAGVGPGLSGLPVLGEGNLAVLSILEQSSTSDPRCPVLLHRSTVRHSYPYDWRTNKPVILRATKQWFINTSALKEQAESALSSITMYPSEGHGHKILLSHFKRQHWCISRQRAWGVPLPVFYDADTQEPVLDPIIVEHVCGLVERGGSDIWWQLSEEELLPPSIVAQYRQQGKPLPVKSRDILDIWFDSGCSWQALEGRTADLIIEGRDQFRGWFLSILLVGLAYNKVLPYKSILVHDFTVDERGQKMSKSVGNVLDPHTITDGEWGLGALGADILRWWAFKTGSTAGSQVCSGEVFAACRTEVQKLRATIRFMLGCLSDYAVKDGEKSVSDTEVVKLPLLDQYALHRLHHYDTEVWKRYGLYNYSIVADVTTNYVNNELSSLYFSAIKHRLYCSPPNSSERKAAQAVLQQVLQRLLWAMTPVLPHLAEEVASHLRQGTPAQLAIRSPPPSCWFNPALEGLMQPCLTLRDLFFSQCKVQSTKLDVTVIASDELFDGLQQLQPEEFSDSSVVSDLLQVASVTITRQDDTLGHANNVQALQVEWKESSLDPCWRCRKNRVKPGQELCAECSSCIGSQQQIGTTEAMISAAQHGPQTSKAA